MLFYDGYFVCIVCMVFGVMIKRKLFFFLVELILFKMLDIWILYGKNLIRVNEKKRVVKKIDWLFCYIYIFWFVL